MSEQDLREQAAKIKIKDSVFTNLFATPEYTLKLYQALHPDDLTVTQDQIKIVTIDNQLLNQPYNDLGFTVGNRLVILIEAQSTWTINMLVRGLLYMAETIHRHLVDTKQDLYGAKKVEFPEPEFYVVYTGDRKDRPEELLLSQDFFGKENTALDVRIKMIYDGEKGNIINQYVTFCHICDQQYRLLGRTREAVIEAIRICKDQNILKEYLASREKEVVTIMMTLYNHEEALDAYIYQQRKDAENRGLERGLEKGLEKGQDKMAALMDKLLNAGRFEDAKAAASDRSARNRLMEELGLSPI